MKFVLTILIAIAVCSASVIKDSGVGFREGDRYFMLPGDGDGIVHLVDTQEPVDQEFIVGFTRNPNKNGYWLYTRSNPAVAQILIHGNANSVYNSFFDSNKETVFIAHGWNGHGNNIMNRMLTEAFLYDKDVNVIVLDWSALANRNYVTAKSGTAAVGVGLGEFVNWLTNVGGLLYQKTHLVGFSLGGHLVGNAGRTTGGRVARITALDPAGPLWLYDNNRVRPSDGQYVEAIHTDITFMGYRNPCGDADFYPNGGSSMPGCSNNSCSHSKVYDYMVSTVKYNHLYASECATLNDALYNRCYGSLNPMGNSDLNKSRSGIFRVNTRTNYPY